MDTRPRVLPLGASGTTTGDLSWGGKCSKSLCAGRAHGGHTSDLPCGIRQTYGNQQGSGKTTPIPVAPDTVALGQRCPGSNEKILQQPLMMMSIVIIIIDIIIIFVDSNSANDRFANVLLICAFHLRISK